MNRPEPGVRYIRFARVAALGSRGERRKRPAASLGPATGGSERKPGPAVQAESRLPPVQPQGGHSAWFYIGWTLGGALLVLILVIGGRFAYIEYQLTQARQQAREALQQEQANYQQIQATINESQTQSQ